MADGDALKTLGFSERGGRETDESRPRRRQEARGSEESFCMLLPRVVQLRRSSTSNGSRKEDSESVSVTATAAANASNHVSVVVSAGTMASQRALDQLIVECLRKRGLRKTLKSFISETSYVSLGVEVSVLERMLFVSARSGFRV